MPHNPIEENLIGKDIGFNINPAEGQFGISGSHTPYTPSAQNLVGNQGQWWTQLAEQDAAKKQAEKQAAIAQQLSNPSPPPVRGFHDYLNSIGAQQEDLGWNRGQVGYKGDQVEGNDQNFVRIEGGKHFFPMGNPVGIGPEYEFGEHADTRNTYRNEGQPAYLDKKGGFLGYGETPDEVFQNSPLLQRGYYEQLAGNQPPPSNGSQF